MDKTRDEIIKDIVRQAMINAENKGMAYNGAGANDEPCTYWLLDDYIITFLTDDETFDAAWLSDDMMDDLIIEER